ncbi:2-keto-4-pentenoate hydratase/2-oxohepta-3-ene-1,7-dioic acid hydratase (catechol pathway) [Candidatus Aquiluna sp. UB-MaderosW2red]|jgi:2-keto-4-pentenoate hydratase/2-oxohepta-3-ene-1,7-dioic acid hydratase in catechol pathway|nr:2-keto-4-pentenoate hydratase/2-oxohepta-3-ene-1,7-dioic acid hydratase (catechol pathway) [Candidatus Aquiluna sp. UB-MaderosW2red]
MELWLIAIIGCISWQTNKVRTARFSHQSVIKYGEIQDTLIRVFVSSPIESLEYSGEVLELSEVRLLAPVIPSKIICIGMNYAAHAAEIAQDLPDEPLMFFKPVSSIIGPGDAIVLPRQSDQVELEVELAIVIGKQAKDISESEAREHIFGYTIGNDVTARDLQFSDLQWARSKGFDTFCPLGPWIETEFEPQGKRISSKVHGQPRQRSITSDMIYSVDQIVSYVSQNVTLFPGDVILTGSPAGISRFDSGDLVECEIEGIGVLSNPVK